jgi:hypothetical protein
MSHLRRDQQSVRRTPTIQVTATGRALGLALVDQADRVAHRASNVLGRSDSKIEQWSGTRGTSVCLPRPMSVYCASLYMQRSHNGMTPLP